MEPYDDFQLPSTLIVAQLNKRCMYHSAGCFAFTLSFLAMKLASQGADPGLSSIGCCPQVN